MPVSVLEKWKLLKQLVTQLLWDADEKCWLSR